jgi:hypothetical protein
MSEILTPLDEVDDWPPVFKDYAEYKSELDEAISRHPPFGEWLAKYRNINHVLTSTGCPSDLWSVCNVARITNQCMWELSVDELKKRYVQQMTLKTAIQNGKRMFAEVHMAQNEDEYKEAEATFVAAQEAYKFALEKYTEAKKHGYKTPAPTPPIRNALLQQKDALNKIACANLTGEEIN